MQSSSVGSDPHLQICYQWSDSIILMVSGTVSFQLQAQSVSISLQPVLGIVTMSWLQSGRCVFNFFHLVRVSV